MKAIWLWPMWQAIVLSMAWGFTQRGKQRFVQWVTGLAVNVRSFTASDGFNLLGSPALSLPAGAYTLTVSAVTPV